MFSVTFQGLSIGDIFIPKFRPEVGASGRPECRKPEFGLCERPNEFEMVLI